MSDSIVGHLINVIGPVFLCASAGYEIARFKLAFDSRVVTSIVTNITMPALVVSHLAAGHVDFSAFADIMLAAVLAVAAMGLIATVVLRVLGLPLRVYVGAMMLANVGNMGLSINSPAFGSEGLAYAMAFWVVVVVGVFTIGEWLPQGTWSLRKLLTSPSVYAVIVGIALMATDTPLPQMAGDTLTLLGGATIPLLLLTLGYTAVETGAPRYRRHAVGVAHRHCRGCRARTDVPVRFHRNGTRRIRPAVPHALLGLRLSDGRKVHAGTIVRGGEPHLHFHLDQHHRAAGGSRLVGLKRLPIPANHDR